MHHLLHFATTQTLAPFSVWGTWPPCTHSATTFSGSARTTHTPRFQWHGNTLFSNLPPLCQPQCNLIKPQMLKALKTFLPMISRKSTTSSYLLLPNCSRASNSDSGKRLTKDCNGNGMQEWAQLLGCYCHLLIRKTKFPRHSNWTFSFPKAKM